VTEFFDRVLNITSLVVVLFPLMICLIVICFRISDKFREYHNQTWLYVISFCAMLFVGAGLMGSTMRRFAMIIGNTQCP